MPRYSVFLHIEGPFTDSGQGPAFGEAYTHRIVSANNADASGPIAVRALQHEKRFACFHTASGNLPAVRVEAVRSATWHEGLFSIRKPGFVLVDLDEAP